MSMRAEDWQWLVDASRGLVVLPAPLAPLGRRARQWEREALRHQRRARKLELRELGLIDIGGEG